MAPRADIDATINRYGNYALPGVTGSMHPWNITGHAGKWAKAYDIPNGQSDFTGSRAGIGGVSVITAGSAVFHLTGGGTSVDAADLVNQGIVELSVAKVTAASSAVISVFKLNTAR